MAYVSVEDALGNVVKVDDPESSIEEVVKTVCELLPQDDPRKEQARKGKPRRWKL